MRRDSTFSLCIDKHLGGSQTCLCWRKHFSGLHSTQHLIGTEYICHLLLGMIFEKPRLLVVRVRWGKRFNGLWKTFVICYQSLVYYIFPAAETWSSTACRRIVYNRDAWADHAARRQGCRQGIHSAEWPVWVPGTVVIEEAVSVSWLDGIKGDLNQGYFGFIRFSCLGFLRCVLFQLA